MKRYGIAPLGEIARELLLTVAGDRYRHQLTFLIHRHHTDTLKAHDRLDQRTGVARSDIVAHIESGVAAAAELDRHRAHRVDQLGRDHHTVGADRRNALGIYRALHIDENVFEYIRERLECVGLVRQIFDFSEIFDSGR